MMNLADITLLCILLATLLGSAFFSGIETGVISLSRVQLRQSEEKGDRRARVIAGLLRAPERLLTTVLVGNNLVNVTATVVFLLWAERMWGIERAELLAPLLLTPLILIFGEILPKAVFRHKADTLAVLFADPLRVAFILFAPGVHLLMQISGRLTRFLGGPEKPCPFIGREDIRLLFIEDDQTGVIEKEEREMLKGVIDFGTTTVREIMVPRIDIVAVRDDAPWEEACETFEKSGHSRLPVYHDKIDDIVGIIYVFDIMRAGALPQGKSIREFMRTVEFVPESKKVHDLLHEFRRKQIFMAIVVDEYGGTGGLVTLEDLIEEIFGEIHDEYDVQRQPVTDLGEGLYVLDARTHREEAEELLATKLTEGEYETLGGFVLEQIGRIPKKGETFRYNEFIVTVLDVTERAVRRVQFRVDPESEATWRENGNSRRSSFGKKRNN
ncbi:MAG: HlyC/CorC family transporter [Candidatus Abyssobacteria bacterium SURF_5]|uniref:HlyC/CorC family transporter n=1 Tax=Abyssobacteria bacterium (strain SURF_5) TaxID=2093360 RepID=A0A3A4ND98_ABYX5|nr:MAG: HlyC/CorC family transporter [Candidatus Abyssubacteria bacterium SURF_5]